MEFDLRAHTHLLVISGSRAYDLHGPASDVDVKGVVIPPPRYYHGCMLAFEQADQASQLAVFDADLREHERAAGRLEGSVYEVRKLLRLAAEANPNILDVLFCRDEEVRLATPIGRKLRDHRHLFVTAKARHTFSGYATAQLKRIETHRRWLLHPPVKEPQRADFDLPERTLIPADQLAAARAAIQKKLESWSIDFGALEEASKLDLQARIASLLAEQGITADSLWRAAARGIGVDENFIALLDRERRYKAARAEWDMHRRWEQNRNVARAALEAKHGYDVKHGAHLVRLLRMGREILETGRVNVWRGDIDAEELRGIRAGQWSYERLIAWAKAEDEALGRIAESGRAKVPTSPDRDAIDRLCVELVEDALRAS
jgi:predicted nucleotidyltransferase